MRKKRIILAVAATLAVLAGVIFYKTEYVTYAQDPANSCGWDNGEVTWSTQVGYTGQQPKKTIKRSEQASFIAEVSKKNQCWYKQ